MKQETSRREFVKKAGVVAATAPFVSRVSWAQGSPMQKLQHVAIGAGGKGRSDIGEICGHDNVKLIAAADVDSKQFVSDVFGVFDGVFDPAVFYPPFMYETSVRVVAGISTFAM